MGKGTWLVAAESATVSQTLALALMPCSALLVCTSKRQPVWSAGHEIWNRFASAASATRGRAKEVGRNPRVVSYQSTYGPSASDYAWEAAGRPVHGIRKP